MAEITINVVSGGLGRSAANSDKWGGLFVEVDTMPTGWAENEVKQLAKPEDLEDYDITEESTNDYYKLVYWHVSEVFRLESDALLYLQLATTDLTPATVLTAFHNAENDIRLFGIVLPSVEISESATNSWDSQLDTLFGTSIHPARAVLTFAPESATGALPDFSSNTTNQRVMVEIANDITEDGLASTIFTALGMCGAAGTYLGQLLLLYVHQKPSWRSYPVNGDDRWTTLGDINGDSVEDLTNAEIKAFDTQGLSLIVRTIRLSGAYIANSRTAIRTQDDYAIINNGRVIDKAAVLAYDGLVTSLDGPVYVDPSTGYLSPETISKFQKAAWNSINTNMVLGKTGDSVEVSVDLNTGSLPRNAVYIKPEQNVLSTETVNVQVRIVPVGSSKYIIINIGLTTQISE